jgi:hypothetical protein
MPSSINPDLRCEEEGCGRPRQMGSDLCVMCGLKNGQVARRIAEREEAAEAISSQSLFKSLFTGDSIDAKLPRCVVYLSQAGDVITLELTGEPRFTEVDVDLCAKALTRRR